MAGHAREFDLVLWGATGFTGQLVAEYIARHPDSAELRWALGGRDSGSLQDLRDRLGLRDIPLVIGDALDAESMLKLAGRSRVVCSTVGPYAIFGSGLIAACAASGTHYCDLSGELPWIRRMIDAYQESAERTGACIVPCCGFDSVPSDLGVLHAQLQMRAATGRTSSHVKCGVVALSGGLSRGTLLSIINAFEELALDAKIRSLIRDPYALNPPAGHSRPDSKDRFLPAFDAELEQWTAPYIMAGINTRVVRRSAALSADMYPRDFRYEEFLLIGAGMLDFLRAVGISALTIGGMAALTLGPVRRRVSKPIRRARSGPLIGGIEHGFWDLFVWAAPPPGSDSGPVAFRMHGDKDPGYRSTAGLLGEGALCLALDSVDHAGFHTPASAMGAALLERIQKSAGVAIVSE